MRTNDAGSGSWVRKWVGLVGGFACLLIVFASCSTKERTFGTGSTNNNAGDSGVDSGLGNSGSGNGGSANGGSGNAGTDGGATQPDGGDGGLQLECRDKADGTPCGSMSGFICVHEVCGQSLCGDGYIDTSIGEECEDGNTTAGDGCEPETCKFSCSANTDCDDQRPCNGVETCDTTAHHCVSGTPPDSTEQVPCARDVVMSGGDAGAPDAGAADAGDAGMPVEGICKSGFCVAAGCGNSLVQPGEDCDDGNTDNADGCKVDCTYTCKSDGDCDDQDICTGTETCNLATHTCVAGTPLVCDDGNDCTTDSCDPVLGCQTVLIDADGDGHASTTLGACGDDCDDNDNTVYPGAGELCDGKDNDCDHSVDENAPIWYLDCDGDGYAEEGAAFTQTCTIPDPQPGCQGAGWTSRIPQNGNLSTIDCFDGNASVYPQSGGDFSATAVDGKSPLPFDWNCDGVEEKEPISTGVSTSDYCGPPIIIGLLSTAASCNPLICVTQCTGAAGYTGSSLPACGASGLYTYCSTASGSCARAYGNAVTHVERCR